MNAANAAGSPATILVSNGVYVLDVPTLNITCPGLVIRSASGDRNAVVIRGPDEGPNASLQNVFSVSATNVVIADLTFGYCRWHGIQAHGESAQNAAGLWVHNCRIINCNEQFIKGSVGSGSVGARDGLIENCLFEFTSGWAYQYYTGGIDIHKGVNWIVRDNLFRNLRVASGQTGMAEHAIHFWNRAGQSALSRPGVHQPGVASKQLAPHRYGGLLRWRLFVLGCRGDQSTAPILSRRHTVIRIAPPP